MSRYEVTRIIVHPGGEMQVNVDIGNGPAAGFVFTPGDRPALDAALADFRSAVATAVELTLLDLVPVVPDTVPPVTPCYLCDAVTPHNETAPGTTRVYCREHMPRERT